ncbi:MAG: hypothetical protein K0Q72_925, partial [Armatimonadetes bacterium]|nr:hypothetical protein [Armatimonadota bacterium]
MSVRPSDPKQNASLDVTEPRVRLAFLDGLRGLAALYVVLFHLVYQEAMRYGSALPQPWQVALAGLGRGRYAVAVFIVISGYCLMLPVARTVQGYLPGGVGRFLQRRARRILPPYYAALAICLLLLVLTALYQRGGGTGRSHPVVEASNLLAHLLLVHDLRAEWAQAIDPPMWSVAVEWHIYLLFPTLLLSLWRRLGSAIAIAIALGLGLLPHYLLPPAENFDWARPWYLGLFTMG